MDMCRRTRIKAAGLVSPLVEKNPFKEGSKRLKKGYKYAAGGNIVHIESGDVINVGG